MTQLPPAAAAEARAPNSPTDSSTLRTVTGSHQMQSAPTPPAAKLGGDRRGLARRFFITALVLSGAAFLWIVRGFMIPILLATVFTTLFYPVYERLRRAFGDRRSLASLCTCLLVILGVVGPLWTVTALVSDQILDLYSGAEGRLRGLYDRSDTLLADLKATPWFRGLGLDQIDWAKKFEEGAASAGHALALVANKTASGTLQFLIAVAVTLFTMFYFFVDGEAIVARLKYLSPLDERHENRIAQRFASVARATIKGTVIIALVQAILGTILLWTCGVDAPAVWGVVMFFLAFIPIVGVKLVLLPAGIFQLLTGHAVGGIVILIASFVVILNVDNILRPRLVGKESQMHDLLIFFATLGGLGTFGIAGLIAGPVLAAFVMSLLEIYGSEFRRELEEGTQATGTASTTMALPPTDAAAETKS
jgi:predicted PurR-regulated permease PerM